MSSVSSSRTHLDKLLDDAAVARDASLEVSRQTQTSDGYWVGRLESNSCMEAQWILALYILGYPTHPLRPRLGKAVVREQRSDGSWGIFKDAPNGDINTTVECYAALKSLGYDPNSTELQRARDWILAHGGLGKVRVFTRYWLALIGEWPWRYTPNLPPEIIHCPSWLIFNIYNFASWARATLMPISILSSLRSTVPLPAEQNLDELFPNGRLATYTAQTSSRSFFSWAKLFIGLDKSLHFLQSLGLIPFRQAARERVIEWIVRHQDADGVWGGIQPPWIYSLLALHFFGYPHQHPVMTKGLDALRDTRWRIDIANSTYIAASTSPVWDTLLTLQAIQDAGAQETLSTSVVPAVDWLLDQEVRHPGDWTKHTPNLEPGGWAFEYENLHYPDVDDSAVALLALSRLPSHLQSSAITASCQRAERWILGMQCKSGGWAAFDRDNQKTFLTHIPFCDFGEVLDPPSIDVTSHVLEALAHRGYRPHQPPISKAIAYIKKEQELDGSWFGRWGVNYIYGTGAVLPALSALTLDMGEAWIVRASNWLIDKQNSDGGWGESCTSYMDLKAKAKGPSTPSQTAWAIMGLCATARPQDRQPVLKGVRWLVQQQHLGSWHETQFTGTGFPGYGIGQSVKLGDPGLEERLAQGIELSRAFMIRYHLYSHYFPVMAISRAINTYTNPQSASL